MQFNINADNKSFPCSNCRTESSLTVSNYYIYRFIMTNVYLVISVTRSLHGSIVGKSLFLRRCLSLSSICYSQVSGRSPKKKVGSHLFLVAIVVIAKLQFDAVRLYWYSVLIYNPTICVLIFFSMISIVKHRSYGISLSWRYHNRAVLYICSLASSFPLSFVSVSDDCHRRNVRTRTSMIA